MKALCTTPERHIEIREVATPVEAAPGHLLIQMHANGINQGDITFLKRAISLNIASSLYDIWGVSGAGTVAATGAGVADKYLGKKVAMYRSLAKTDCTIGCWSEITQMPASACVILPDDADPFDYAGSLVNIITPYAFWKQAQQEQHKGILVTAGSSATGIAMLGIALAYDIPLVSIVRNQTGRQLLESLGAKNIVVQSEPDFGHSLVTVLEEHKISAVFDGVGGSPLNRIIPLLARGSGIYSYGYLGGDEPFVVHPGVLMAKRLEIRSFSNFGSQTVQDPAQLDDALTAIARIIGMPHFKTRRGKSFGFDEIDDAMASVSQTGHKAILVPPGFQARS